MRPESNRNSSGPSCSRHFGRCAVQPKMEYLMTKVGEVVYTAKTHTIGGRESGVSRSCDGRLDIRLSTPRVGAR